MEAINDLKNSFGKFYPEEEKGPVIPDDQKFSSPNMRTASRDGTISLQTLKVVFNNFKTQDL